MLHVFFCSLLIRSIQTTEDQVIVFTHVPKTAGASFWLQVLYNRKSKELNLYPPTPDTKSCHDKHHCTPHELMIACFMHTKPKFITVLREPVRRVVSEFFWALKEKRRKIRQGQKGQFDWSLHDWQIMNRPSDLARWVTSPHNTAHNRQTHFFGRILTSSPILYQEYASCASTNTSQTMKAAEERYGRKSVAERGFAAVIATDIELLRHAKIQIEKSLFFVGLAECISESVQCFFAKVGISSRILNIDQQEIAHKSHAPFLRLSKQLLRDIAQRNRADSDIYKIAQERFSRECGIPLKSERKVTSFSNDLKQDIFIVTAISQNHAAEVLGLIATAQRCRLPLILYDLGLYPKESMKLRFACGVEYISRLPASLDDWSKTKQLYGCAWKPAIIADAMSRHPTSYIVWTDASIRLKSNAAFHFRFALNQYPLLARRTIGDVGSYTHPDTIKRVLRTSKKRNQYLDKPMLAATVVGLAPTAKPFIDQWSHWSLDRAAFQPDFAQGQPCDHCRSQHPENGHCYRCHRFDQSIFNLLVYSLIIERSFKQSGEMTSPLPSTLVLSFDSINAIHNATLLATITKRGQRQLPRGLSIRWCRKRDVIPLSL
uniref:Sulfotransferase domain-containing protein n=1 Tax=Aureoumbra lagunensis TaxID=44058 RepID=A0A7S3K392_9STRA